MRSTSAKRARQLGRYRAMRLLFLVDHPVCESPWNCGQAASEVHHMAGRSGDRLLDASRFKALCHGCHQRVTEYPTEAIELGLSLSRVGVTS